ncbi:peptidase M23, partial [Flavonifractor sp. An306]
MAKTQKQPKRQKVDKRRVMVAVLAGFMALLILLPMFTMIMGGAGAVTQSEIDALKQEQAESQARQEELKDQLAEAEEKQS